MLRVYVQNKHMFSFGTYSNILPRIYSDVLLPNGRRGSISGSFREKASSLKTPQADSEKLFFLVYRFSPVGLAFFSLFCVLLKLKEHLSLC